MYATFKVTTKGLENTFSKNVGLTNLRLSNQVDQMKGRLDSASVRDLNDLVRARNSLVHEANVNSLQDLNFERQDFVTKFEKARKTLSSLSSS